jgi:Tat protein translocase TatB subunit
MDFLGVGIPELIVIIILALVLVGPRELPRVAEKAGKLIRELRMMSEGFTSEWRREIVAATRLEEVEKVKQELADTKRLLKETGQEIKDATGPERATPAPSKSNHSATTTTLSQTVKPENTNDDG